MFLISLYIIYNYTLLPHLCQVLFLYLDEKVINFGAYMSLLLYIYACVCVCLRTYVHVCIMWGILQKKRYLIY